MFTPFSSFSFFLTPRLPWSSLTLWKPLIQGLNVLGANLSTQGFKDYLTHSFQSVNSTLSNAIWITAEKLWLSHLVRICSDVFKWATTEDWDVPGAVSETSTGGKDSSWSKSPKVSCRFPGILQVHPPWCSALDGISGAPSSLDYSAPAFQKP